MDPVHSGPQRWGRNVHFVFACIGAAVGLGNLWRFPYMAYENGGSAFLIPYLLCVFVLGLPLLCLEFGIGRWGGGSVAQGFAKAGGRWHWIGWWTLLNSMVIVFYYAVVLAWCAQYVVYSFTEAWRSDPAAFFQKEVLNISSSPFVPGGFRWGTLAALAFIWLAVFWIVKSGTGRIAKVLAFTVPLPAILLLILCCRSATLPGSGDGLSYLLKPSMKEIMTFNAWAAAASQVVLSLSLGMGQMVVYASMKKDDASLPRSGLIICLGDTAFALLSSLTVFASMGALAFANGVPLDKLKLDGLFLAFVSYPMAISAMPLAPVWGVVFFTTLLVIGLDSVFAVVEANMAGFQELTGRPDRQKWAMWLCLAGFAGGLPFVTGAGLYWLDVVDHWVAYYSIAALIVLTMLVFGRSALLRELADRVGGPVVKFFGVWRVLVKYFLPLVLVVVFGVKLVKEFGTPYGEYPWSVLLLGGWGMLVCSVLLSLLLTRRR